MPKPRAKSTQKFSEVTLQKEAELLARALFRSNSQLVLAESCTGGLASATLTRVPGISRVFCGSWVVYQPIAKTAWLGLEAAFLKKYTDVSEETSALLALQVLERTPTAKLAAGITGHLGPGAPKSMDGKIFIAVAVRASDDIRMEVSTFQLDPRSKREARQSVSAELVLRLLRETVELNSAS